MFEQELELARAVAARAAELALTYRSQEVTADAKPDLSPVTIADRECERLIAGRIGEAFPDDGFLGEEGTRKEPRNGRLWIVDPIDGTRDFVRGLPLWAQLIALEVDGEVVMGVCSLPPRGETYFAVKGQGAWRDGQRLRVSAIDRVENAVACVGGLKNASLSPFAGRLTSWMGRFWAVRSLGGCLDAMLVAGGNAEVWIEPQAKAWDLGPLKIILEEAGGRFLNFDGGSSIYGGNAAGCVPALEDAVRELVEGK